MLRCLCTLLLMLCSLPAAAEADCSRYSEFGLTLGMTNRQVWQSMGERGEDEGRTRGSFGYLSIERYEKTPAPILVHYDGTVGKKSSARVVSIETTFEEKVVDIPDLIDTLRTRLGEPSSGEANLENGLRDGPVEWMNSECDVRVTLFRRAASWWEPSASVEFHVKIDALSFVQTGKLGSKPVPAEVVPQPSQIVSSTPAPPVSESAAENATLSSASASGQSARPGDGAEPASRGELPAPEDSVIYFAGVNGVSHPVQRAGRTPELRLPASARGRNIDGHVILEVVVRRDGSVGDIVVLQVNPSGLGLERAAVRTVKKWRYRPAELDGQPVDARVNVSFRFE